MRIVLDMEAAQSPGSRNRGIGRYAIGLAKGMLRQRGRDEVLVALSGMYSEAIAELRAEFAGLISPADILVWHGSVPPHTPRTIEERRAMQLVRDTFFASLRADFVHVMCMFPFGPSSFPAVGGPDAPYRTTVTLHDLIPHVRRDVYLRDESAARDYYTQFEALKRADLLVSNSESTRQEGLLHLALPPERIVNCSSAADDQFTAGVVPASTEVALRVQYGLWRPFAMYTGGLDHRKNVDGLIRAWAKLPAGLRRTHQLAIVCHAHDSERARLQSIAREGGLNPWDVVFTGFVPDAHLVQLYRMAKLFVFPSLHEGFGLPLLEAMNCGTATIGSDVTAMPEVIGRADALFDAQSPESIAAKIRQCLEDESFLRELRAHALVQARQFSWDLSGRRALDAMQRLGPRAPAAAPARRRPTLAYVSPLPPQRTGIADYSAQLLPALARHYDIDLVVEQEEVDPAVASVAKAVRDPAWLRERGGEYDRLLYHVGNSQFHEYMLPLLHEHPGTVMLHDFFLSGLQSNREFFTEKQPRFSQALYESHGWGAFAARWRVEDMTPIVRRYPANFEVLRDARGVLVHSPYSKLLAGEWYGPHAGADWPVIPLVRELAQRRRKDARRELGLADDDFLVCSFGIIGPLKLSDRLLQAWQASSLREDPRARLMFVGENDAEDFGREFDAQVRACAPRASVTGWASAETFRRYLDAADVAVQLRTLSRGESSAAVLDVMNHGVPLVVNANGSMAYLPADAVWLLPDDFTQAELVQALESLRADPARRAAMGAAGRRAIEQAHTPEACAAAYARAIEDFALHEVDAASAARRVAGALPDGLSELFLGEMAQAISTNHAPHAAARQLLVDVTPQIAHGVPVAPLLVQLVDSVYPGWRAEPVYLASDGQWRYARVYAHQLLGLWPPMLEDDPLEVRPADVWCAMGGELPRAEHLPACVRDAGLECIAFPSSAASEAALAWVCIAKRTQQAGPRCFVDISELVRYDWQSGIQRVVKNDLLELLRLPPARMAVIPVYTTAGAAGYRVARKYLYELAGLPQLLADDEDPPVQVRAGDLFFGLDLQQPLVTEQEEWLAGFRRAGGRLAFMLYDLLPMQLPDCFVAGAAEMHERWLRVIARSDLVIAISDAVAKQFEAWLSSAGPVGRPAVRHVHLGADIALAPSLASQGLPDDAQQLLERVRRQPAFLMVGTLEPRKAYAAVVDAFDVLWSRGVDCMLVIVGKPGWLMDELAARLRGHAMAGSKLVWLESASDEFLEALYRACGALVLASRGEGFGLPLIEAAQRGLPLIARDLPVFRELAGGHAFYFGDDAPDALAASLEAWLRLHERGEHPNPQGMRWLTWIQSAAAVRRELESLYAV